MVAAALEGPPAVDKSRDWNTRSPHDLHLHGHFHGQPTPTGSNYGHLLTGARAEPDRTANPVSHLGGRVDAGRDGPVHDEPRQLLLQLPGEEVRQGGIGDMRRGDGRKRAKVLHVSHEVDSQVEKTESYRAV